MSITDLDEFTTIKWRMTEECNFNCPYCIRGDSGIKMDKERLLKEADFISGIETDRPVKIDMIGGEVTIIPYLEEIYEHLKGKVARIQITTNTSKPASYFNHLNSIIETSLMCSWHPAGISLDKYMETVSHLKVANLTLEMVSTRDNQDEVREFIGRTKDYNVMVDIDRNEPDLSLIHLTTKRKARYECNGRLFYSKPELLDFYGNGKYVYTNGLVCNREHFIYIQNGCFDIPSSTPGKCCDRVPIDGRSINEALICKVCTLDGCTLCGHMTIS